MRQARVFDDNPAVSAEVDGAIRRFAETAMQANAESVLDMKMFYNICCSTVGSNYILSDISGLAAQVEVRSPFLDYRVVEFAARLPHRFKVGSLFTSRCNKYLLKFFYEKYVPKRLAWSRKKGLSYNIRFSKYIEGDKRAGKLFSDAYDAIDHAGLSSKSGRAALGRYMSSLSKGAKPAPFDSRTVMNSFLLGRWLMLHR
jgi:asparagine synthase (glutamine-hydrolysing)